LPAAERVAGLDRDHVGTDRADCQGGGDAADDISVGVVAVQQQDLDQGAGATAVAVGLAGRGPERRMRAGERPGGPGLDQRGGAAQRPGLTDQHLQVVVQHQHLTAPHGRPFMPGDLGAAVEQHQL